MYGTYGRSIARQSILESQHRARRSRFLAETIKKLGGEATLEQLAGFSAVEVNDAIEIHRTIHPVAREANGAIVEYYVAN